MDDDLAILALDRGLSVRASEQPTRIVAAVVSWRRGEANSRLASLRISDGERAAWLEVCVPARASLPPGGVLEEAVERFAAALTDPCPLSALEAVGSLTWTGRAVVGAPPED